MINDMRALRAAHAAAGVLDVPARRNSLWYGNAWMQRLPGSWTTSFSILCRALPVRIIGRSDRGDVTSRTYAYLLLRLAS